jgi:hypothetical protein
MAKISELPELVDPAGTETVPVLIGGITRRARLDKLAGAAAGTLVAEATNDLRYRVAGAYDPAGARLTGNTAPAGTTAIYKKTFGQLFPDMGDEGGMIPWVEIAFEVAGPVRIKLFSTNGTGQPVYEADVGTFTPPAIVVLPALVRFTLPTPVKVAKAWRGGLYQAGSYVSALLNDGQNQTSMSGDYTVPTRNPDNNNATTARLFRLGVRYKSVGEQVDTLTTRVAAVEARGGGKTVLPSDTYLRAGELLPFLPDMTRIAWWGSSTMDYLGTELGTMAAAYGATPYAGGKAGELLEDTLARFGSRPALLNVVGGSIPADRSAVACVSQNGQTAALKPYAGTLAGVAGTLSWSTANNRLEFVRDAVGTAVPVADGTPMLPTIGRQHRNAVTLLNIGKNNFVPDYASADFIAQQTHEAFDWLSPFLKRVLVINHYVDMLSAPSDYKRFTKILEVNQKLRDRYGAQCVDLYAFICKGAVLFGKTVWQVTGVTPTAEDLAAQVRGNKPPSLSSDDQHLNAAGNVGMRWLIQQYIAQLGWY